MKKNIPKTQKGKSIFYGCPKLQIYINNLALRAHVSYSPHSPITLIQSEKDIQSLDPSFWRDKIFARPCPKVPRHGFVDSRIVSSSQELSLLLKEVLAADSAGEIILTSFIDKATCNAVLATSGLLSIGPGHDGATAGKKSFSLPVKPASFFRTPTLSVLATDSGLHKENNLFVEAVFTKMHAFDYFTDYVDHAGHHITQIRGGPTISYSKDYIPFNLKVLNVIKPNTNLVAWEKEVKKLPPGTVVYGDGHTLASHAAIHCVLNKVPFITSYLPTVGDTIKASLNRENSLNYRQFRLGTTVGLTDTRNITQMLHTSVCVLHNWVFLRNSEHASWLLGLAAGYLVRVLCALNFGEYRHYINKRHLKRHVLYKKVIRSNKIGSFMRQSPKVAKTFVDKTKFKYSYGGPKWATSVKTSIRIWNSMSEIQSKGLSNGRANKLLSLINNSINLIHNNGWLFNKVSNRNCLDIIQSNPGLSAFQFSDIFYDTYQKVKKVKRLREINPVKAKV